MRAGVLLAMDGLVLVHAHALLATVVVLDHGPTLLPQEGKMTPLLPQRERKSAGQNHQDSQKNMMRIRTMHLQFMKSRRCENNLSLQQQASTVLIVVFVAIFIKFHGNLAANGCLILYLFNDISPTTANASHQKIFLYWTKT